MSNVFSDIEVKYQLFTFLLFHSPAANQHLPKATKNRWPHVQGPHFHAPVCPFHLTKCSVAPPPIASRGAAVHLSCRALLALHSPRAPTNYTLHYTTLPYTIHTIPHYTAVHHTTLHCTTPPHYTPCVCVCVSECVCCVLCFPFCVCVCVCVMCAVCCSFFRVCVCVCVCVCACVPFVVFLCCGVFPVV